MLNDSKENTPDLWLDHFPWPATENHKYSRGHAIVAGGGLAHTGAARLAARAALRIGAGLVSVACGSASLPIYAAALEAVMTKTVDDADAFRALLNDPRINAVLVGPGCGVTEWTRERALLALRAAKTTVLDADALSIFENDPSQLFAHIQAPCILTPHEGEFARLFPMIDAAQDRVDRAIQAAVLSHAVVVLKGHETIIASPKGEVAVNKNASAFLATAGSGDVLAGMCAGLMAQGMPVFEAACASVWIHGATGSSLGAGMIAEDLPDAIPAILHLLLDEANIS